MNTKIGKLENVVLRELWKHEERGFSAWLEQNLDELGQEIGVTLSDPRREVRAGKFEVDLVAETENGGTAIIENQLEATNHDHLGKVVTYLSNLDAKIAVWICKESRAEHIRAIQWLNETTPDDIAFYLVQLSAFRIGDSDPAPLFTAIVRPSAVSKDIGKQKKEVAERHTMRQRFWTQLLARARSNKFMLHAARSPSRDHWLGAGAGIRSGVAFNYLIWMDEAGVELYIDTQNEVENKRIFDKLYSNHQAIESAFGGVIEWNRLEHRRACRVIHMIPGYGLKHDEALWPDIQARMVEAMTGLYNVLMPYLRNEV